MIMARGAVKLLIMGNLYESEEKDARRQEA